MLLRSSRAYLGALVGDGDDIIISAITAAELLVGVHLADALNRDRRSAFVDDVLASVPIEDYDIRVAQAHAELLAQVSGLAAHAGPTT